MNEYFAQGSLHKLVQPSEAARHAQLDPGTPLCDAAVAYLERSGAVEPDEQTSGVTIAGSNYPYYRITPRGMDLIRRKR